MSLSFLTPSRTVLLVSDEFLSIMTATSAGVKLIETFPWDAENFEASVASVIAKDCGKKPVLILNDMVEQHYRKERVIKAGVNFMDKSAMIQRKLNVAFSGHPYKSAYPLKEKIAKKGSAPASDVYIFAALSASDQVAKTIESAKQSLASLSGFCLLPVEASDMVKELSVKLGGKNARGKKNEWAVFVGQHSNGSLRQVLTKNGDLALTRMSPMIDSDDDPEEWAEELYTEFKSTMSYLARFGYSPDDGLDVFVTANGHAADTLEAMFEEECNLNIMGVDQYANHLGIRIGPQTNLRYADPLHVGWTGRKSKFILPLKADQVSKVSGPRRAAMFAGIALLIGASVLGYMTFNKIATLATTNSDIQSAEGRKSQLDAQLQREKQRLEEVGFDAQLVQGSIEVYTDLEAHRIRIMDVLKQVGKSLGKDLRFDTVNIERFGNKDRIASNALRVVRDVTGLGKGEPKEELFTAKLKMTYPSTADVDLGNDEVASLSKRIETLMPGHKVQVTKFLKDYEYTQGLVVEAGDLDKKNVAQDFVAEIEIEGYVQK